MSQKSRNSKKQLREFGILLGIVFPVLFGFIIPLIFQHNYRVWTLWIGIPFLIIGIYKPILLNYPFKGWMFLGDLLGWINSRLILCLIYFTVLLPIALIMRLFGYDPLKLKKESFNTFRVIKKTKLTDFKKIF